MVPICVYMQSNNPIAMNMLFFLLSLENNNFQFGRFMYIVFVFSSHSADNAYDSGQSLHFRLWELGQYIYQ